MNIILPASDAAKADLYYEIRAKRLATQKQVDQLQAVETALSDYFINSMPQDTTGIAGRVALVQVKGARKPRVSDWPALYAHILETRSFELLQRRLGESAVEDRWANGAEVPGVERMNVKKISCTKL